jgi:hypothetical protein
MLFIQHISTVSLLPLLKGLAGLPEDDNFSIYIAIFFPLFDGSDLGGPSADGPGCYAKG